MKKLSLKSKKIVFVLFLIFFVSSKLLAATNYVSKTGNHISPFDSWANAATNIQVAVDAASSGNMVLVTNGTYYPASQILITKGISVKSVNGAKKTIVDGGRSHRCFYLNDTKTNIIKGFTITNGYVSGSSPNNCGGAIYFYKGGIVENCIIVDNFATGNGGGVNCDDGGYVLNSVIIKNQAIDEGGGVFCDNGLIQNCIISDNIAGGDGGGLGSYGNGYAKNCTIVGNISSNDGGGVCRIGAIKNSIIYYNFAKRYPNWCWDSTIKYDYNCTTPLPFGDYNISDMPKLLDFGHIATDSPCVTAGDSNNCSGVDIDGDAWQRPPAVGCDQPVAAITSGKLKVKVYSENIIFTTDYSNFFSAIIYGRVSHNTWSFDDGKTYENDLGCYHSWDNPGVYKVILTAFNDSYPVGVSATVIVEVIEKQIHYVNKNNLSPLTPYSNWESAATNIQDAVNVATNIGDFVIVTNGTYYPSSEIKVQNNIIVKSVNGANKTIVNGNNKTRCFNLNNNSTINGFTITNGIGGVYCYDSTILNCIIAGNTTSNNNGGGVYSKYFSEILNTTISKNLARDGGGIICYDSKIENCNINKNNAIMGEGGGIQSYNSTIKNCILHKNIAEQSGGGINLLGGKISDCAIYENEASISGGGIYSWYNAIIQRCNIRNNKTSGIDSEGGGIYIGYDGSFVQSCLIVENSSTGNGGGAYCRYGSRIYNCTISKNTAHGIGNGIYNQAGGCTIANSIIYFNGDDNYSGCFYYYCCSPGLYNYGNITNNPEFRDINGNDYRLESFSPCIDIGNNNYVSYDWDLDDNPRIIDGTVDMGAYEYIPEPSLFIIYYLLIILYLKIK